MADQLTSIQTHLWVITGLFGLCLVIGLSLAYALFEYKRDKRDMQKLANFGKYSELLALTKKKLTSEPENDDARVYQAIALYGLKQFDEARAVAEHLFAHAPLHNSAALDLLNAIDRAKAEA